MSGINILRKLLLKEAVKGSGQASGIMSIGNNVRKLADKRLTSYLIDAQKQGVDIDGMNEQQIKYMLEMNKPKAPRVISQGDPEFKGITRNLMDALDKDLGKNVIQGKFGRPFAEELKKFRGPVKEKQDMGNFGKINVEVDYSASLDRPEFFDPKAKNMFGKTVATGSEFIKKERERILNIINRKKKEMVSTTHPNYRLLKKSLQDQEDALEAIKITEDLGGNENMFDFLRTKNISDYKSKPLKRSNYVKTDDPEDFADGGRTGFAGGTVVKKLIEIASRIGLDFNKATDVQKQIIQKYGNRIDDKLLDYMVYDPNKQRQAEVMASIDEAVIMMDKGMSPDDVITAQKKSFRTKNADGGVAGLLGERTGYGRGYLVEGAKSLGKKYKGSTLQAILENPKLLGAELGHDGIMELMRLLPSLFADGGPARQNFAMGKRAFLKLLGSVGAGIGALKTGIGLGGKKAATEVAKDVATTSATTPPPYFFNLVKKIKNLGDDVTPTYANQPREKVTMYKDYQLTENLDTGEKTIQRYRLSDHQYYDENLTEEVYMNYRPGKGQMDETTKGKTPPDEYTEDTGYLRTSGPDKGELYDTTDGVIPDDVIQEGTIFEDNIADFTTKKSRKKKASGGLAHMVGE